MADIELVIRIPEEEYRWIMKSDKTVFRDVASKECMLHAIKNGIPLPNNPTNGDMVKAVFPNFEEDVTIVGDTILLERYMPYCKMQFHRDWWDAPYKEKKDADSN